MHVADQEREKRRKQTLERLTRELPFCASKAFKIKDKQGRIVDFVFNKAQLYAHSLLEEQRRLTGKVRALVLKGRQQGMSTYIAARFYHKTRFIPGTNTFILSHQTATTGKLFDMVKRINDNLPEPLQPVLAAANRNQLKFEGIDSEYSVGTAGNEEIGRGFTIKLLHGSEVASFENTDELETGLFQAVADMDGTEIILESTANGMGNLFHRKCMDALAGIGEYILIFIPWFWQDEYRKKAPADFLLSMEEVDLKTTYGLDNDQLYWRRLKIIELGGEQKGGKWKFMQEYPMNVMEAFIVSGDPFFSTPTLMAARKRKLDTDYEEAIVAGFDAARSNDRAALTVRQGRKVLYHRVFDTKQFKDDPEANPTEYFVDILANAIDNERIDRIFIDMGSGYGIVDGLKRLGYGKHVTGIYFNQRAIKEKVYANKRAEMYGEAREWLTDGPTQIPDDDDFFTDLAIIPREKDLSGAGKVRLEEKSKIKAQYGRSPDITDSFILTFAMPVLRDKMTAQRAQRAVAKQEVKRVSPFKTVQRISRSSTREDPTSIRVMVNR